MIPRVFVVAALAATLPACSDSSAPDQPGEVTVQDNQFNPAATVPAGNGSVTWTWRGTAMHNVTFEDGQGNSNDQSGGIHTRFFATTGVYQYRCTNHSSGFGNSGEMVGLVVVE